MQILLRYLERPDIGGARMYAGEQNSISVPAPEFLERLYFRPS